MRPALIALSLALTILAVSKCASTQRTITCSESQLERDSWISANVKLYHPPCAYTCWIDNVRYSSGITLTSYVFQYVDLAKQESIFKTNQHFKLKTNGHMGIFWEVYRPRVLLSQSLMFWLYREGRFYTSVKFEKFTQECSHWSYQLPPLSTIAFNQYVFQNNYFLEMYGEILTQEQMVKIARGHPESVVVPSNVRIVTLTMMFTVFADCVPIIGGVQFEKTYGLAELFSHGVYRLFRLGHFCNVQQKVETYTMTIYANPRNNGEYGMHCRRPNDTDRYLYIGDPVRTIKIILHMGDLEGPSSEPPVIELLISGSHLIVPPQNTSAFFDVKITPPPDEITFFRTTGGQWTEDIVQTEVKQGLFRIAFYRVKDTASGVYQLNATLKSQTSSQVVTVTIADKIVLHVSQLRRAVAEGVSAELVCTATGWPLPQVNWTMGLGPVPQNERINITTEQTEERKVVSTIRFTSSELKDSGYYVCVASNPVDQESWEVVYDVYPLGSHFVDKGFGDVAVTVNLDAGEEDEDYTCEDGTCEDIVSFDLRDGDQTEEAANNPSGTILTAVVVGAGVLVAAVVVVLLILLAWCYTRKCGHKLKGNRGKGGMGRAPSLLAGKRMSVKTSWKASPESKPLLQHSHTQGGIEDNSELSDCVNSDTSAD